MKYNPDHTPRPGDVTNALFFLSWFELKGETVPEREKCLYRLTARIGWVDRLLYIGRSNHGGNRIESHGRRWVHPLSTFSGVRIDTSVLIIHGEGASPTRAEVSAAETYAHQYYPPILEGSVATHLFPDQRERIAVVSAMLRHDKEEWSRYGTTSYDAAFDPWMSFEKRRAAVHRACVDLRVDIDWTLRWCENPNGGEKPPGFHRISARPQVSKRRPGSTMYPKKDEDNGVGRGEE